MKATVSTSGDADATVDVIPPVLLNTKTAMMYVIAQMGASVSELSNTMSSNAVIVYQVMDQLRAQRSTIALRGR